MTTATSSGGLNLVRAGSNPLTLLSPEFVQPTNVIGAQFGSVIKLSDGGYAVYWLSRGGPNAEGSLPAKPSNDIAMMRLGAAPDYTPQPTTWITNTANIHEMNLHVARYGNNRLLMSWDSIESFTCSLDFDITCLGQYTGTHFQLLDLQGNKIGPDEVLPYPPNERDDLVTFPNGDVGWAFVPEPKRQYSTRLYETTIAPLPAIRKISIARMLYCQ